jgi:uncharacterized protein
VTAAGTAAAAFGCGAAVGVLGGLIGLGGAEFRLPLLLGLFALAAHQAVRLNLLVSLATAAAAAIARFGLAPAPDLAGHLPEVAVLAMTSTTAAYFGAGLLARLDAAALTRVIAALLLGIAALLVVEVAAGDALHLGLEPGGAARPLLGAAAGVAIGLASSLLGVAGGELIIPTLVFGFGMDIKAAGTASLLVSLPTVAVGVMRFRAQGAYRDGAMLAGLALPMAVGSAAGATLGAALLPLAPIGFLKLLLGGVLAVSAIKLTRKAESRSSSAV